MNCCLRSLDQKGAAAAPDESALRISASLREPVESGMKTPQTVTMAAIPAIYLSSM